MERRKRGPFFKNIIRVEVLSEEEPIKPFTSLAAIEREFTDGEFCGHVHYEPPVELTPDQTRTELLRMGSDPSFFRLDLLDELKEDLEPEDPNKFNQETLAAVVKDIQGILWRDGPDTEWDSSTADSIAARLRGAGLAYECPLEEKSK
jgi:hypothetical protein